MKTNLRATYILLFALLMSCSGVIAQPTVKSGHTNQAIVEMVLVHERAKSVDVFPEPALINRFNDDFPDAADMEWERTTELFEVEFEMGNAFNRRDYKAYYDTDYNLIAYKHEVARKSTPEAIKATIDRDYPGFKVEDIDRVVMGTDVHYKVEIERGEVEYKLVMKEDGSVLPPPTMVR